MHNFKNNIFLLYLQFKHFFFLKLHWKYCHFKYNVYCPDKWFINLNVLFLFSYHILQ